MVSRPPGHSGDDAMTTTERTHAAVKDTERLGILVTTHARPDGYLEVTVIASVLDTYPTHVAVVRAHHIDFFLRGTELAA